MASIEDLMQMTASCTTADVESREHETERRPSVQKRRHFRTIGDSESSRAGSSRSDGQRSHQAWRRHTAQSRRHQRSWKAFVFNGESARFIEWASYGSTFRQVIESVEGHHDIIARSRTTVRGIGERARSTKFRRRMRNFMLHFWAQPHLDSRRCDV